MGQRGGSSAPSTATWADSHQILTDADRSVPPAPSVLPEEKAAAGDAGASRGGGAGDAGAQRRRLEQGDAVSPAPSGEAADATTAVFATATAPLALDADFAAAWRAAGATPRSVLRAHAFPPGNLQEAWKGWESNGYRAILDAAQDGVAEPSAGAAAAAPPPNGTGSDSGDGRDSGWSWWSAQQGRLVLNAAGERGVWRWLTCSPFPLAYSRPHCHCLASAQGGTWTTRRRGPSLRASGHCRTRRLSSK